MTLQDSESLIALVALFISLLALLIASLQLSAQIFATAEGTRKCSPSVLGEWGKKTRWRWRWNEGRFETLFTTPEIFLGTIFCQENQFHVIDQKDKTWYMFEKEPELCKLIPLDGEHDSSELVGWIPFLRAIRREAINYIKKSSYVPDIDIPGVGKPSSSVAIHRITWPCAQMRERSFDFMPQDLPRPLATCNISDIGIMVRRMGMIWKEFDPAGGNMAAEGGIHTLTSVYVRGLGLVLQYRQINNKLRRFYEGPVNKIIGKRISETEDQKSVENQQITNYTIEADKLIYGILPGHQKLGVPDFCIGTWSECLDVFRELIAVDGSSNLSGTSDYGDPLHGLSPYEFNDILLMAPPFLRPRGSPDGRLPYYHPGASLLHFSAAHKVFNERLTLLISSMNLSEGTPQLLHIYKAHQELNWYPSGPNITNLKESPDRLEMIHRMHDNTTSYFMSLAGRDENAIRFYDLLKAHVTYAIRASAAARASVAAGTARTLLSNAPAYDDKANAWRVESMHLYFDYIPKYAEFLARVSGCTDETLVTEAWVTLIFRGFCWRWGHMLSSFRGDFLPSQWYNSKLPVYLG